MRKSMPLPRTLAWLSMRALICWLLISAASSFSRPLQQPGTHKQTQTESGRDSARQAAARVHSCTDGCVGDGHRPGANSGSAFQPRPATGPPHPAYLHKALGGNPSRDPHPHPHNHPPHPTPHTHPTPGAHPTLVLKKAAMALRSSAAKGAVYCVSALLRTAWYSGCTWSCRWGSRLSWGLQGASRDDKQAGEWDRHARRWGAASGHWDTARQHAAQPGAQGGGAALPRQRAAASRRGGAAPNMSQPQNLGVGCTVLWQCKLWQRMAARAAPPEALQVAEAGGVVGSVKVVERLPHLPGGF